MLLTVGCGLLDVRGWRIDDEMVVRWRLWDGWWCLVLPLQVQVVWLFGGWLVNCGCFVLLHQIHWSSLQVAAFSIALNSNIHDCNPTTTTTITTISTIITRQWWDQVWSIHGLAPVPLVVSLLGRSRLCDDWTLGDWSWMWSWWVLGLSLGVW